MSKGVPVRDSSSGAWPSIGRPLRPLRFLHRTVIRCDNGHRVARARLAARPTQDFDAEISDSSLPLPEHSAPINSVDWFPDLVGSPVVVNCFATALYRAIVVDDDVAPDRQVGVEIDERVLGGFIHISVQAQHCPLPVP